MLAAASSRVAYTANVMGNGHLRGGGGGGRPEDQSKTDLEHHQLIGQAGAPTLEDATTDHNLELISALAAIQEENRKR